MLFSEAKVCELIEETWGAVLDEGLSRVPSPPAAAAGYYSCTIEFGSGWGGLLSLDVSRPLAQSLAAGMFGREADELDAAQISNAVGELANMLAGGINGMLSEPAQLSLPVVQEDLDQVDYRLRHAQCVTLHDVSYACAGEPLRVTLARRIATRERAADTADSEPAGQSAERGMDRVPGPHAAGQTSPSDGIGAPEEVEAILAAARAEADRILNQARAEARRIRASALDEGSTDGSAALQDDARRYALEVLGNLESYTHQMLDSVRKSREWIESQ